jgi:hypothetical protein
MSLLNTSLAVVSIRTYTYFRQSFILRIAGRLIMLGSLAKVRLSGRMLYALPVEFAGPHSNCTNENEATDVEQVAS